MTEVEAFIPHLSSPRNIGIFGGSYDPPHIGHSCAILYALSMHRLDEIWVIPCGQHPDSKNLINFWDRFKMCKIAFGHLRKVRVLPIEHYMAKPTYTNLTLRAIAESQPNANLHLIVGADCYKAVPEWHGSEETLRLAKLLQVPRSGYDDSDHLLPDLSSTAIRKALKENGNVDQQLDAEVRQYIHSRKLYGVT